jgi:hypothetical protein
MKLAELLNERKSFKEEIELPRSPESLRDEVSNISPPLRGGDEGEGVENNHHKTPPP